MSSKAAFVASLLALGGAMRVAGATWAGEPLNSPMLGRGDRFGATLAIGADMIVVGAYLSDAGGTDSGAIYFYRKTATGWELVPSMTQTGAAGDQLGFDLAIDGTTVLAGAPFARQGGVRCGAVRRFTISGGQVSEEPMLRPEDCEDGAEFGSAVAVRGEVMAVGARGADRRKGRIYATFNRIQLPDLQPLAADVQAGDELGTSLSIDGTRLVAGAPFSDQQGTDSGAVYVFAADQPARRVLPQIGQARAAFGYSVVLTDNHLVAGAPLEDGAAGLDAGAVFRFDFNGDAWNEIGATSGAQAGDQFGVSVSQGGIGIVVGARRAGNQRRGAVYLLGGDGTHGAPFVSPRPQAGAEFGFAVAARGMIFAVGAFLEDGPVIDSGAAYVFEMQELPPQEVSFGFASLESCVFESEGRVPLRVIVTTSDAQPTVSPVTVRLQTCPQPGLCTAMSPDDFSAFDVERTVPAGTASGAAIQLADLMIGDDSVPEDPENLVVRLSFGNQQEDRSIVIHDSPFVLAPGLLNTSENGGSADFEVSLACSPAQIVRVSVSSTDATEGTVSRSMLRFTTANWDQPQHVVLHGIDDSLCDGPQSYQVQVKARSADPRLDGQSRSIPAVNADDEPGGLKATQSVCAYLDNTVVYTVDLHNDCPQPVTLSLEDQLPPEVAVVTAGADSGTATVDYLENSVVWNGSVPAGGTTVLTIAGGLNPVAAGTEVANPALDATQPVSFERIAFRAGDIGCPPEPP
jgi:hypothetical protein